MSRNFFDIQLFGKITVCFDVYYTQHQVSVSKCLVFALLAYKLQQLTLHTGLHLHASNMFAGVYVVNVCKYFAL